jgi:hypothetical protein
LLRQLGMETPWKHFYFGGSLACIRNVVRFFVPFRIPSSHLIYPHSLLPFPISFLYTLFNND